MVQDTAAIRHSGDDSARAEAERRLIAIAQSVGDAAWRERQRPAVEAANRRGRVEPTAMQLEAQLVEWQDRTLATVRSARFLPPEGGGATIVVPLTFLANE